MNEQEDLGCALAFVIGRIEQEATRSGETLSEEQRFLLHNLPRESSLPAMAGIRKRHSRQFLEILPTSALFRWHETRTAMTWG